MEKIKIVIVYSMLLLIFVLGLAFINRDEYKAIFFRSNIEKGIDKFWNKNLTIVAEKDIELNGKVYKLVLSTPTDSKSYKYFNCYEQKMGGLYYKNYQAAEQGGSNAEINFSIMDLKNTSNIVKTFTFVYGYNVGLEIDNYGITVSSDLKESGSLRESSISDKEYFIDVYEGHFNRISKCIGRDGSDRISAFYD